MNARCFKTVFSKRLGALVAVGEHAASQGKAQGASCAAGAAQAGQASWAGWSGWGLFVGALTTSFALVTLAWAQPAVNALPTGGQVVQGAVQFNQSAQQLNIQQGSDRAAVNWQSFDIGAAAKVNVVQPSAQSVLLNRVGGESPSQIFGQLTANGQVILVNPNGMVFGRDGSVSAAGFTGSTLNISDADFMAGKAHFTRSGNAASTSAIVNRGLIQAAPGGYVALLGASVSNEGRIEAPQGNVFMAAADAVTLPSPTVGVPIGQSGRIKLELTPASINAAVANQQRGTIVTDGGQVYLQAAAINQAMARIIQSGSIDTTGVQGGQVHVLADGGLIRVDGSIKANSTGTDDKGQARAGGDIYIGRDKDTNVLAAVGDASGATLESKGGFVETSGSFLKVDDISVKAKDWLLDPTDITISTGTHSATDSSGTFSGSGATSIINRNTLQTALATTNVTITTASSGGGNGDITVSDSVTWTSGNSLTLNAIRNILLNAALNGKDMTFNAQSVSGNTAGTINTNGGVLTLNTTNVSAIGTILGNISGSGSLVKTGAGTVTLSGAKTYTGGTTVSAGSLVGIDGGNDAGGPGYVFNGFGTGKINIASSATALVNNSGGTAHNRFINTVEGEGTLQIRGTGGTRTMVFGDFQNFLGTIELVDRSTQLTGNVNTSARVQINFGATLMIWSTHGNPVFGTLTGLGRVVAVVPSGSASMTIGNGGGSGSFDGQITNIGTISITKIGAGTQNLTGNNNYTGTTTVNRGSLVNSNMASLRTSSIAIAEGATFEANVGTATTYLGSTTVSGGGTFKKNGAGVLTLSNGSSQLIFGTAGSSTLSIPPAPFTGLLDIAGGAIRNEATKGAFTANGSTINIASGSWLDIRGEAVQMRGLTGQGNIINSWNSTNALTFGVGSTASDNFIYNGVIGAANGATPSFVMNVTKSGAGTQVLAGNNLYTGTTTVSGGTLQIGNGGATGTLGAGAVTLSNNANLKFVRAVDTTISNDISGVGNVVADITSTNATPGNLTVSSTNFNLSKGTSGSSGLIDLRADGNVILNGSIGTDNATVNAIKLVAGQALGVGGRTGGNVVVNNNSIITVGNGGVAAIYSGSIDGTTGIGDMAEEGSGKFRYNSDETTTNFTKELGKRDGTNHNGVNIIYREKPTLQINVKNFSKTYDGLVYEGGNGFTESTTTSSLKNGDSLAAATANAAYGGPAQNKRNAGHYDLTASEDMNALGYGVTYIKGKLTIARKDVTLESLIADNKIYDGNTGATISSGVISGTVGTETLAISGSGSFDTKNAGSNKIVTVSVTSLSKTNGENGGDWNNYNLTTTGSITTNATITPRPLDVTIAGVQTVYGSSAPAGTATVSGVLANDVVSADATVQLNGQRLSTSGNLNVGTYVQTAAVSLSGADAGNYTVGNGAVANYVVTPKQITPTATAADKVYDGNTNATLVASGVGILAGDVVTVQGLTGNFASKNVARDGSGNVVAQDVIITGTGSSLGGTDGANYTLVGTASVPVASARITPKDLSLAGITAADKVYDGNTTAQLSSANAVLTGLVAGDSVNVSVQNAQGNFVDKNVARGANGQPVAKQVLVSGLSLTGADQGNYQLGSSADVAATITPRTVTLTGSRALDKVVDSTTTAQVLPGTLQGLVAGEQLGVNASGEFEDALVGTNKLVNARFALVNGANGLASNYDLANTTAQLRAAIVALIPGAVTPGSGPQGAGSGGNRVSFSGASGAGAATGLSDEPVSPELLEQCSVLNPEKCECEDTKIPGVQMCFAPAQVVSLKD